jgi:hypothetical protein
MVIDGKLLLRPVIVELDAEQTRVGVKLGRLFEAQLSGKQGS